ncbi:pentatricopeptide repeat-containing protein At1g52620-like [Camellia sinensis]|uniref:pentatricopeptide repeat-containing protein At1g52620-like n=1 Tax=Camellia sinensis TaxID=4442 RepID=UPI001035A3FD|nr:pentatricopeptide repeat-containing protein At1g52620-like [Camellia sinensis]
MSKTLLSRIKPRHNPKPSSSPSFSFKPLIKRLVNELCDILKPHHHNQWQDTLETHLSEEEIVPSDIAHLVLDRIRDPELGLKFFDWVTQRPYGCSLDGFAYSSLLKLLASSRVFSEIETVLESMKVEDKLPTREALDAVIRAYSDSGLVDKALEIYTTVLSTSNSVPSVLACNSLLNALVKEGRIEIASRVYDEMFDSIY